MPRYVAMMRNGFDAPPSAILQRFLGFDLSDPNLVTDAISVLDDKIKALESMYNK